MTGKRKVTEQIKKLRQISEDIIKHSELIEQEAIRLEVDKMFNVLTEMETANEEKRKGER